MPPVVRRSNRFQYAALEEGQTRFQLRVYLEPIEPKSSIELSLPLSVGIEDTVQDLGRSGRQRTEPPPVAECASGGEERAPIAVRDLGAPPASS